MEAYNLSISGIFQQFNCHKNNCEMYFRYFSVAVRATYWEP